MQKATHTGKLIIGNITIPCAVLKDGSRVITQTGFLTALGRSRAEGGKSALIEELPPFLNVITLKPFITKELAEASRPIEFLLPTGRKALGYRAELLPDVCGVYLDARDAGVLNQPQQKFASNASLIVRALATIGVIALIDEATGYQEIRDKTALQAILDKYLRKEHAEWAKRFPDKFYEHIFRLKKWDFLNISNKKPWVIGKFTNDIVYERIAPGLLLELQTKNPKDENGRKKTCHHQWLTADAGIPELSYHINAIMALMRASNTWEEFYIILDKIFPKSQKIDLGSTQPLKNNPTRL